jgi:hypothetical protein
MLVALSRGSNASINEQWQMIRETIETIFEEAGKDALRKKWDGDLYDRRLKIRQAVMGFIASVVRQSDANDENLITLLRETSETRFLCREDVEQYINALYNKGIEVQYFNKQIEASNSEQSRDYRVHLANLLNDLLRWFSAQLKEANNVFDPYLSWSEVSEEAAEQLSRICGYHAPERVNAQAVEVKVNAAVIEQVRACYAELGARERGNGPH